jgi:hypothetical protein
MRSNWKKSMTLAVLVLSSTSIMIGLQARSAIAKINCDKTPDAPICNGENPPPRPVPRPPQPNPQPVPPPTSSTNGTINVCTALPVRQWLPPHETTSKLVIQADGSVLGQTQQPLLGLPDKFWNPGTTLRVRILGGSVALRNRIERFANEWTTAANISFNFTPRLDEPAEIRVEINTSGLSDSTIGRDALTIPPDQRTMQFGWLTDASTDEEVRRVTLHEFGHALGLEHEHKSPLAGIQWNKEVVFTDFANRTPPWDRAKVQSNIFDIYSKDITNFSAFDAKSIMLYAIPARFTTNEQSFPSNTTLSATDRSYIAAWYPRDPDRKGVLKTKDDCDFIPFEVKNDALPKNTVEFKLVPGKDVTWWKSIQIPMKNGADVEIQMQDGNSSSKQLNLADIDTNRPIRFGKAKFLGEHRLLDFTWAVLPAISGGSRVVLTWQADSCDPFTGTIQ